MPLWMQKASHKHKRPLLQSYKKFGTVYRVTVEEKTMEDSKILLGKVGEWIWYKYYYDKENDCFTEEKYHEEYLDTGTVFEGSNTVSAQYVYKMFVEHMNTEGITNFLKCIEDFEVPQPSEKQMTDQDFLKNLEEIDKTLWRNLKRIDSTYILRDKQGSIIGVLSKTTHFFVYIDLYKGSKGFVSKNEAFHYIIECLSERHKSSNTFPSDVKPNSNKQFDEAQKKSNILRRIFKKK